MDRDHRSRDDERWLDSGLILLVKAYVVRSEGWLQDVCLGHLLDGGAIYQDGEGCKMSRFETHD